MAEHRERHLCCPDCTRAGRIGRQSADWHHNRGLAAIAAVGIAIVLAAVVWVLAYRWLA